MNDEEGGVNFASEAAYDRMSKAVRYVESLSKGEHAPGRDVQPFQGAVGPGLVTLKVTGAKDGATYPGLMTLKDTETLADTWWDDDEEIRVLELNGKDLIPFTEGNKQRYTGRPIGRDFDGFALVLVDTGGGDNTFWARCTGGTWATGFTFSKLTAIGPNVWVDADPPVTGTAYRTPSAFQDNSKPVPPNIPVTQTIQVKSVTWPAMTFGAEYTAGGVGFATLTFDFTPGEGTSPYIIDVDWGDGTTPGTGVGLTPSHTFVGTPPWTVVVTLKDNGTPVRNETKTLVITALPTDSGPVTPTVNLGPPITSYICSPWGGMFAITVMTDGVFDRDTCIFTKTLKTIYIRDGWLDPSS